MKKSHVIVFITALMLPLVFSTCGSSPNTTASAQDELDMTLREVSDYLNESIPSGRKIAFINIQSTSTSLTEYILDELMANAVNDRIFSVVDRQQLDAARAELNFNMSGEVSDQSAQSVGQMLGAQTIITGRVSQIGERYRLNIRALEVETVQVQGSNNWNIAAGSTITALMRGGGGSVGRTQSTTARTTTGSTGTSTTSGSASRIVPTITSLTINPETVSVNKGKTHQFEAAISGTNDPDLTVIWTITGNLSGGTSIGEDGLLTVADDEIATPLTVTATSTIDRSKSSRATVTIPGGITALNVSSTANWNTAINTIRNGGDNQTYIINVVGNISVPTVTENLFGSVSALTVTIHGSGTLSISASGNLLRIGARQTVIARNVTLRGHSNNNGAVVQIDQRATFRLEGNASVTGNTSSSRAGGVAVNGGTFIIDGGSVTGNSASSQTCGGGVYVTNGGTLIMESGKVTNNNTSAPWSGAGVTISDGNLIPLSSTGGTFIMRGGTISDNTNNGNWPSGGGVCIHGGTFTMEGGTISGNTTNNGGGGVFIYSGAFTKIGGTIYGGNESQNLRNTTRDQGHAVHNRQTSRWRNATIGPNDSFNDYGFWND